jgi:hypothetical protein
MSSLLILTFLTAFTTSAQYATTYLSISISPNTGCGNLEFDINFMKPRLTIYEAKALMNFSVTDTMDLNNPMKVTLNGQSKFDPVVIDQYNKQPLCTKRLLLDVCVMPESGIDRVNFKLEIDTQSAVCYLDLDRYGTNAGIQS